MSDQTSHSARVRSQAAAAAARRWSALKLPTLASARIRELTTGSPTDWGMSSRQPDPGVRPISLGGGIPDAATLPRQGLLEAMQRALATADDAPLSYGGALGYEPLRAEIGRLFARDHRQPIAADHFVLTNGAAGGIDLVCSALLDPGDVVITEVPAFSGSLRTIRGHQARIVGVPMDADGMRVDALEAALESAAAAAAATGNKVKLIYTSPTFHNPTGATMTPQRRAALVELAARHAALIVEDTAYNELYFGQRLIPTVSAVADEHFVITAGTFSKVIAPGLRVGWVQARPELIELLMPARFDMGNSPLLHRMLHEYLTSGELEAHVARMRGIYAEKMKTLAAALRAGAGELVEIAEPAGGFFLWVRLAEPLRAVDVQAEALDRGLSFPVARPFYLPDGPPPGAERIRLAYSRASLADLAEGATRLIDSLRAAAERSAGAGRRAG